MSQPGGSPGKPPDVSEPGPPRRGSSELKLTGQGDAQRRRRRARTQLLSPGSAEGLKVRRSGGTDPGDRDLPVC